VDGDRTGEDPQPGLCAPSHTVRESLAIGGGGGAAAALLPEPGLSCATISISRSARNANHARCLCVLHASISDMIAGLTHCCSIGTV